MAMDTTAMTYRYLDDAEMAAQKQKQKAGKKKAGKKK